MRELSSKTATIATQRAHDLILDYIKEAIQGLAKMSINRIRRASIEEDEWDALKTFENVASKQQKKYEIPSTQIDTNVVFDDDDEGPLNNAVFTQKPLSQQQETINNQKGSELFKKSLMKTQIYMTKTKAYQDLGTTNLLESLVKRTNNFLYGLCYKKHITQKQYEKLKVNKEEVELAHLCFLPKVHKPNTPLRPIMAGLKSPTIGISKWLDGLLRPLFDRLASETTILNGVQLIKQVERWSATYLTAATSFITMDVTDLYTMISQEGRVTALKRLIEASGLKQIDGVKKAIILVLTRFIMTNNYFYLDGSYYKKIREGAMGSPLIITITNAYMYFVERPISKWANRTCSLYYRYIDDLFIMSNVHADILK
ncbi:unnamed protein product, partial [Rotaria sp. Silwood1]